MPAPDPTICFVGPAVGGHRGHITTQGEVLADLFRADGRPVLVTSSRINKVARAADSLACILRWRRAIDVAVISVFSGRAFMVADLQSRLAATLHLPTVLWLHGGALPQLFAERSGAAARMLARAEAIVAPSTYLADAASSLGFEVAVIPNVLDLDRYAFRRRRHVEPRLLWMRTFHPLYRPTMALDVLAEVRRTHPDARLTMAGHDAGDQAATEALASARGLTTAVRFPGFLDPLRKATELNDHDIFLNTNEVDNTPVSVLEAAASGLPVVATAVGGLPALLDHERTGLLVPDGDAAAMAAAVERLVAEPALADALSVAGRALAERSAWPTVRDAWTSLVDDVLAGRPA